MSIPEMIGNVDTPHLSRWELPCSVQEMWSVFHYITITTDIRVPEDQLAGRISEDDSGVRALSSLLPREKMR